MNHRGVPLLLTVSPPHTHDRNTRLTSDRPPPVSLSLKGVISVHPLCQGDKKISLGS